MILARQGAADFRPLFSFTLFGCPEASTGITNG